MDEKEAIESRRVLDLLFSYMPKIAAERKMDRLLVLVADLGRSIVLADRCSLWLIDEDRGELWTKVAHGVDELRIPLSAGFVGYSVRTGESLLVEDAYQDERFDRRSDEKTHYRTAAVMTVPLRNSAGKIMGVFQAINKTVAPSVFTKQDLERLGLTAVYSAKTVESALLTLELEETQKKIIHILGEASEYRSLETGNHIQRVAEISAKIAAFYGLPEKLVVQIKLAAPLHDLGKIGIPDALLNKPDKLTDEEFMKMRSHVTIGRDLIERNMLSSSNGKLLRVAAEVAGTHHERWDGKGYPKGLKGEEIPLAGRICAVADVLDALASPRCYKEAWPEERVKEEFAKQRGLQFQPELVDILFEHWDEIYSCYRDLLRGHLGEN